MLTLEILPYTVAICRLDVSSPIPQWATQGNDFFSITKTEQELSIVCLQSLIPANLSDGIKVNRDWAVLKVVGQLDFSLTGILYSIAKPLAENKISIFAISTYDTDYILVSQQKRDDAVAVLAQHFSIV